MQPGQVIDQRFRLIRQIAEGGMGSIWAALHETLEREVAIKFMRSDADTTPVLRQRFMAEARVVGRLRHPNIVDVVDTGELEDGTLYIVFEMLDGQSMDAILDRKGWLSVQSTVRIAAEVCRALEPAHAAGIVHRDLKPGNVFLHRRGDGATIVKILDFGISKIRENAISNVRLTQDGTVVGTPSYMSYEQARGDSDVDHRTDIWSVGVLIYEMLTGRPPFDGDAYGQILDQILGEEPPPLSATGRHVPEDLVVVVDRCMSKDRTQRYSTARELRIELERLLRALPEDEPDVFGLTRASEATTPPEPQAARPHSPPPPPPFRKTPRRSAPTPRLGMPSRPFPSEPPSVPSGLAPLSEPHLTVSSTWPRLGKLGHKRALAVLTGVLFAVGLVVSFALRRGPAVPSPAAAVAAPPSAPALTAVLPPPAAQPAAPASAVADDLEFETTHTVASRSRAKPAVSAAPKVPQRTRVDNPGF